MAEENSKLKERVRAFWQEHPCGTKFADAPPGSRRFYELVEAHRYEKEWHIPTAAGFAETKNLHVLEVGCANGRKMGLAFVGLCYKRVSLVRCPLSFVITGIKYKALRTNTDD